jgi:hypothetical protein
MSANILFISRNDLVKRTPIGGDIDSDKLIPFVKTAQDKYMLVALGTVLYEYLQAAIANGTIDNAANVRYKYLLDYYIVDTLVHYTFVEALPFLAYQIDNTGITKNLNGEQGASPSKNDVDYLLQKELGTAQFYAERLVTYLIAQNTLYPQYLQTTGFSDNVYPDKGQQYRNGWVI